LPATVHIPISNAFQGGEARRRNEKGWEKYEVAQSVMAKEIVYKQFCVWKSEGKLLFLLLFLFMFIDIFHLVRSNFSVFPLHLSLRKQREENEHIENCFRALFSFIHAPLVTAFHLMCLVEVILWSFCMFFCERKRPFPPRRKLKINTQS
jgi:hypothetical protein